LSSTNIWTKLFDIKTFSVHTITVKCSNFQLKKVTVLWLMCKNLRCAFHLTVSASYGVCIGELEYQAQSPDEGALVGAARNFGFVFRV